MAGWLFVLTLAVALIAVYRPFGDDMYRVVTGTRHHPVERGAYKIVGVDANAGQTWGVYARSVLAFSTVSLLFLYALLRLQDRLWLSLGLPAVTDHIARGRAGARRDRPARRSRRRAVDARTFAHRLLTGLIRERIQDVDIDAECCQCANTMFRV